MRASLVYCAAGLATALLATALSAARVLPGQTTLRGSAMTDYGTAVPLDPTAQRRLMREVASFDGTCVAASRVPKQPWLAHLLDAVAATHCERAGSGATDIVSARFADTATLDAYFDEWRDSLNVPRGACDGSGGLTTWARRDGRLAGRLLCGEQSNGSAVAWTSIRTATMHVASGPDLPSLVEWWQHIARPQGRYPTRAERTLLDLVASRLDRASCTRATDGGSPLALAAIRCATDAGGYASAALASFQLHTPRNLTRYLYDSLTGPFRVGIARTSDPCRTRSFQLGNWGTAGRGTLGTLLCYPGPPGYRALAWTIEKLGLYGQLYAVGADEPAEIYALWAARLRGIGS